MADWWKTAELPPLHHTFERDFQACESSLQELEGFHTCLDQFSQRIDCLTNIQVNLNNTYKQYQDTSSQLQSLRQTHADGVSESLSLCDQQGRLHSQANITSLFCHVYIVADCELSLLKQALPAYSPVPHVLDLSGQSYSNNIQLSTLQSVLDYWRNNSFSDRVVSSPTGSPVSMNMFLRLLGLENVTFETIYFITLVKVLNTMKHQLESDLHVDSPFYTQMQTMSNILVGAFKQQRHWTSSLLASDDVCCHVLSSLALRQLMLYDAPKEKDMLGDILEDAAITQKCISKQYYSTLTGSLDDGDSNTVKKILALTAGSQVATESQKQVVQKLYLQIAPLQKDTDLGCLLFSLLTSKNNSSKSISSNMSSSTTNSHLFLFLLDVQREYTDSIFKRYVCAVLEPSVQAYVKRTKYCVTELLGLLSPVNNAYSNTHLSPQTFQSSTLPTFFSTNLAYTQSPMQQSSSAVTAIQECCTEILPGVCQIVSAITQNNLTEAEFSPLIQILVDSCIQMVCQNTLHVARTMMQALLLEGLKLYTRVCDVSEISSLAHHTPVQVHNNTTAQTALHAKFVLLVVAPSNQHASPLLHTVCQDLHNLLLPISTIHTDGILDTQKEVYPGIQTSLSLQTVILADFVEYVQILKNYMVDRLVISQDSDISIPTKGEVHVWRCNLDSTLASYLTNMTFASMDGWKDATTTRLGTYIHQHQNVIVNAQANITLTQLQLRNLLASLFKWNNDNNQYIHALSITTDSSLLPQPPKTPSLVPGTKPEEIAVLMKRLTNALTALQQAPSIEQNNKTFVDFDATKTPFSLVNRVENKSLRAKCLQSALLMVIQKYRELVNILHQASAGYELHHTSTECCIREEDTCLCIPVEKLELALLRE